MRTTTYATVPERVVRPRDRSADGSRKVRRPTGFVPFDFFYMPQRQTDVVEPVKQAPPSVVVDLERRPEVSAAQLAGFQVDGDLRRWLCLDDRPQPVDDVLRDPSRQQSGLAGVAAEDVGEPRGDDDPEPVVLQRPDRVLA